LPRVTKPRIGSGGTGLQQRASCVASPPMPTTSIAALPVAAFLGLRVSAGGGAEPFSAI
jgi:hypothetical protein